MGSGTAEEGIYAVSTALDSSPLGGPGAAVGESCDPKWEPAPGGPFPRHRKSYLEACPSSSNPPRDRARIERPRSVAGYPRRPRLRPVRCVCHPPLPRLPGSFVLGAVLGPGDPAAGRVAPRALLGQLDGESPRNGRSSSVRRLIFPAVGGEPRPSDPERIGSCLRTGRRVGPSAPASRYPSGRLPES